jgi:hypothetical protein
VPARHPGPEDADLVPVRCLALLVSHSHERQDDAHLERVLLADRGELVGEQAAFLPHQVDEAAADADFHGIDLQSLVQILG